jgi:hypothetical protein
MLLLIVRQSPNALVVVAINLCIEVTICVCVSVSIKSMNGIKEKRFKKQANKQKNTRYV